MADASTKQARGKSTGKAEAKGALEIAYWPIDRLVPFARNARTHSDAQVAELAGSIRTFGFANPILASPDGDVIAGHGRLAAARQQRMSEDPVIVVGGLSEIERRQLVLADNRIALNAGWDMEMLKLELKDLGDLGADLSALGFSEAELASALSDPTAGLTDEDEVPEVGRPPSPVPATSGASATTGLPVAIARTQKPSRLPFAT